MLLEYLKTEPEDNFLRHALALEYVKSGNFDGARELFESILRDSPDYVASYYHLGKLLESMGEIQPAMQCYEKGMTAAKNAGENRTYAELQAAYEELAF